MRVLVCEGEARLAAELARGLRGRGAAVDVATNGTSALDAVRVHPYDVVVLGRELPAVHCGELCRAVNAERPETKILMLGAGDVVAGLALGADDYLCKPFRFDELAARVHALARRAGTARPAVLRKGELELDPARRAATRGGRALKLTPKELGVLEELLAADGAVVSAEDLLERVWDANVNPLTNTVRMTLMKLRRKLGDPPPIETVRGAGYRI